MYTGKSHGKSHETGEKGRDGSYGEGDAPSFHHPGKHVAPQSVGAEDMLCTGSQKPLIEVHRPCIRQEGGKDDE